MWSVCAVDVVMALKENKNNVIVTERTQKNEAEIQFLSENKLRAGLREALDMIFE